MTNEHVQVLEGISFDGPLSPWLAIVFGLVLALVAYWSLFRVPADGRGRLTPVLWLLRVAAIAIVALILAGPVRVVTHRHVSPKTLAVVSDVSASMSVVDPPDKSDVHWQAAAGANAAGSLVSACDRAAVACAMGREQLTEILRGSTHTADPEGDARKLETAARAVDNAANQMPQIVRLLDEVFAANGFELVARANEIAALLAASRLDETSSLLEREASGGQRVNPNALTQIEQWHRELGRATRELSELTDRITDRLAGSQAATVSEPLARREKIDRLLKAGDATWLAGREASATIRHYAFDRQTVVVTGSQGAAGTEPVPANAAQSLARVGKKKPGFTNLSSPLERVSRDAAEANTAAVILLSDGRHNDPAAADPRAVAKTLTDLPVYVVSVGAGRMPRDIVLHHVEGPVTAVEGDQIAVEAIVSAYDCAGEKCTVELSEGNSVVAHETLDINSARRDFRVRLATKPKGTGKHEYKLRATPVKGEAVATNNAASFNVDVIDATLKVLVADDVPRWEHRYLTRLFERDDKIKFDEVLFQPTASGRGSEGSNAEIPHDVDGWARYRLVILGDLSPSELDAKTQRALKEYIVDRGGTLVLIAGPQSMPQAFAGMPLADLVPVTAAEAIDPSQGYGIALSAEGRLNAAMQISDEPGETDQIWKELSEQLPLYGLSNYCVPKPAARTLLRAFRTDDPAAKDDKAFVCWQTVGRGRVVYVASPTVYQLRLKNGDRYHHRFWGQLVRWAVSRDLAQGSRTVKLMTDRTRAAVDENVQVIANLNELDGRPFVNARVQAQISAGEAALALVDLSPDPKIPGRYVGEFSPMEEGLLTIQASGADVTQLLLSEGVSRPISTTLAVDPGKSLETDDTRSNGPLLAQIARLTGGQVVSPAAIPEVVELTNLEPRIRDDSSRTPLWDRWPLLWALCGVLVVEWAIRKSTGLP